MKSTLLKTLAATSLVATTHAEIQVLGASFKERGISAPNGTIELNPGTVAATRGYLIMDDTVLTAAPNKATYIEYGQIRDAGVVTKYYSIDSDFSAFLADSILGDSGGRRLYGHMRAPVLVANVTNPLIPFSGTQFADPAFPRKLSFDQTVFQTGASDAATGPQIVSANSQTLRSVVSGSANPVSVSAPTISGATNELLIRLKNQGYVRTLAEAPSFTTNLDPTLDLTVGQQQALTVVVSSDVVPDDGQFPAPTYQWYKDTVLIPGAVGASYTVTGGTSTATNGFGSYRVVATNSFGSATSNTTVVGPKTLAFATQPEPAVTLVGASTTTLTATLNPVPVTAPTYQWKKSPAPPAAENYVNIAGATGPSLLVVGNEALTGAGLYKLEVTSPAGTILSNASAVTISPPGTAFVFTTNSPRALSVAFDSVAGVPIAPIVNGTANPTVQTRQWQKAPLNNPTAFVDVLAGDGGNGTTLTVFGTNAKPTGPGVYRLVVTSTGATPTVITSISTTVTTAP